MSQGMKLAKHYMSLRILKCMKLSSVYLYVQDSVMQPRQDTSKPLLPLLFCHCGCSHLVERPTVHSTHTT